MDFVFFFLWFDFPLIGHRKINIPEIIPRVHYFLSFTVLNSLALSHFNLLKIDMHHSCPDLESSLTHSTVPRYESPQIAFKASMEWDGRKQRARVLWVDQKRCSGHGRNIYTRPAVVIGHAQFLIGFLSYPAHGLHRSFCFRRFKYLFGYPPFVFIDIRQRICMGSSATSS